MSVTKNPPNSQAPTIEQLKRVAQDVPPNPLWRHPIFDRCPVCNGELIPQSDPCRFGQVAILLGDCEDCGTSRAIDRWVVES